MRHKTKFLVGMSEKILILLLGGDVSLQLRGPFVVVGGCMATWDIALPEESSQKKMTRLEPLDRAVPRARTPLDFSEVWVNKVFSYFENLSWIAVLATEKGVSDTEWSNSLLDGQVQALLSLAGLVGSLVRSFPHTRGTEMWRLIRFRVEGENKR